MDAIARRIWEVKATLRERDNSMMARGTLKAIRTELALLTWVPPATAAPRKPISSRSKPELLPGVRTAIDRISDALKALNGEDDGAPEVIFAGPPKRPRGGAPAFATSKAKYPNHTRVKADS